MNGLLLFLAAGLSCTFMLFVNSIDTFINWKGIYSPSAARSYAVRLKQFLVSLPANIGLSEVTGDDVVRFHKRMEDENYSRATIAFSLSVVKNFFFFWKNRGEQVVNPGEIKSITYTNRLKPVVTQEDFRKMSSAFSGVEFETLQTKLAIHLLWDTGMRISELIDLKLSDLRDPNADGVRTAHLISKKSSKYNLVAWSKETDVLLSNYLQYRLDHSVDSDSLFVNMRQTTRHHMKITSRTIQRWVRSASNKVGIAKRISPHSFRHGKAHHMLDSGANIRDVQAVLRHVNPVTTFHYLSLNDRQFIEVAGKYLAKPAV